MGSTNYFDTFITVAPDCTATAGVEPPAPTPGKAPTIARRLWELISNEPYGHTSDDVIFAVYAERHSIPAAGLATAREVFFSKGQPCLRAADLGKKFGWGVHYDAQGRIALYGVETARYRALASGHQAGTVKAAMRSARSK